MPANYGIRPNDDEHLAGLRKQLADPTQNHPVDGQKWRLPAKFPAQPNREFLQRNREFERENREFIPGNGAERFSGSRFRKGNIRMIVGMRGNRGRFPIG
jgi:hypothetical protein